MKREELEAYKSKKEEIQELRYKLEHVTDNDAGVGVSVINDYRSGFPHPQAVVGYDYSLIQRRRERHKNRISKLEIECEAIEEFIEAIEDSITRRILRMYFLESVSQEKIAKTVHLSQSAVSKKISEYCKME